MPESILVTGSSGMIGTALSRRLLHDGYQVVGADSEENTWSEAVNERTRRIDLRDDSQFDDLPTDVDLIVHLAANSRVLESVNQPTMARENLVTTFNVLDYAREVDAGCVFGSSREVYGSGGELHYEEDDVELDQCENPYAASKIGGEALMRSFEACYDVETALLRFSNVYGRYDVSNRVIPIFIAQAIADEDLTIFGAQKVLDFTYLDDCVDGIVRTVESFEKAAGTAFNIASGRGYSLVELAEAIVDHIDCDSEIHIESNRSGEVSRFVGDISLARAVLDYDPAYSFEEGLAETIDWYRDHPSILGEIR